jgi:hypothetical protein
VDRRPRLSFVNSRAVGCSRPTHITGEVAGYPDGLVGDAIPVESAIVAATPSTR